MPLQKPNIDMILITNLSPVWDARGELDQLRSIVGAVWYLSRPRGDDEMKNVSDLFGIIQEKIGENVALLTQAIEQGKLQEVQG